MTREQIAEMAQVARERCQDPGTSNEWIIEFANLVAAAEREACAKVCDGWTSSGFFPAVVIAQDIRARGNT